MTEADPELCTSGIYHEVECLCPNALFEAECPNYQPDAASGTPK
jgi:hypothetical protein